jgi:hypothetical protein
MILVSGYDYILLKTPEKYPFDSSPNGALFVPLNMPLLLGYCSGWIWPGLKMFEGDCEILWTNPYMIRNTVWQTLIHTMSQGANVFPSSFFSHALSHGCKAPMKFCSASPVIKQQRRDRSAAGPVWPELWHVAISARNDRGNAAG